MHGQFARRRKRIVGVQPSFQDRAAQRSIDLSMLGHRRRGIDFDMCEARIEARS
jgi:hypothetical protein